MQCGCAVASTDAGGFLQYCKENYTALISSAGNPAALSQSIERLITDDALRIQIAKNANNYIQRFTWERSYSDFKKTIALVDGG